MTRTTTRTTTKSKITAEEIHRRILDKEFSNRHEYGTIICSRCERDIARVETFHMNPQLQRYITLRLPPEPNRVKPKDYGFHMCQWCVTEFLKSMQEKEEEKK